MGMEDVVRRNPAKEPVTIRLDVEAKAKLHELAGAEDRTVSSLIDLAVREFLDRRFGVDSTASSHARLRIRHADLPDTSVLRAFHSLAREKCDQAIRDLNLPSLEFVEDRPEWLRLLVDVFSGESDLVESVNWLPIFWHVKRGGSSPRLDWIGPYLQLFVGHHVFVRRDLVNNYLDVASLEEFERFRDQAHTGRDLSLRSLVAWARQSGDKESAQGKSLETIWADAVVACQLGTDYHIAVRRVAPILAILAGRGQDALVSEPPIPGIDSLNRGFHEFCNGTVTAFTGNLLHSADLLTDRKQVACLLAGPADVRVPSLNTLAGRKGMFAAPPSAAGSQSDAVGGKVLELWSQAVNWFRDEVIDADSDAVLRQLIASQFPDYMRDEVGTNQGNGERLGRIAVVKNLMQTWVKWFADPNEARAFLGEGHVAGVAGGKVPSEDIVQHYEHLCDQLNPAFQMTAPCIDDSKERAFWKFPVLGESVKA